MPDQDEYFVNWGKDFINLYTKNEKESLESLVDEAFQTNLNIMLGKELLSEICKIWWVVLGSFGNTALFDFVTSDHDFARNICQEAGIRYDIYQNAVDELKSNNVADIIKEPENAVKFTLFLFMNLLRIFMNITDAPADKLYIKENPSSNFIQQFYIKASEIMEKGSVAWRESFRTNWNDMLRHPEQYM